MEKKRARFRVGDRVRLNPLCGLNFEFEEAKLWTTYTISEVIWSHVVGDWHYHLGGIHCSYQPQWLVKAPEKELEK